MVAFQFTENGTSKLLWTTSSYTYAYLGLDNCISDAGEMSNG